ncbi:hypothetical protein C8R42DRAFT_726782 [Lentinula raphanica]|nr:hypothetical protein C8R42DRAFT_726782 [Lentinula raphanica]
MASSSKASSSKKSSGNRVYGVSAVEPPSVAQDFDIFDSTTLVMVYNARAFTKIINGHHAKADNSRRLLQFIKQTNFADCLRYYQEYWHYTIDCPLFAPLLITLVCDFCEEHLSPADYKKHVYDGKSRTGYGLSAKTRQRIKDCLDEPFSIKTLAIPIPFDPNTREGQIIVTIASRGTDLDQIRQPSTNIALRPDPSKRVVAPKPSRSVPAKASIQASKLPPRPSTPEDDDSGSEGSSLHGRSARSSPQKFPVPSSPIEVEEEEDDGDDIFPPVSRSPAPVPRQSIARTAKAKPPVPEVLLKVPGPPAKRPRATSVVDKDPPVTIPPAKKRRTQVAASKAADTTSVAQSDPPASPLPLRIQEGEPEYRDGDDTRTSGHQYFLTNPDFTPKAPFSQLIRKTVAQNPRAPKLPFLRRPKWKISEEMKNFGAFINSADTSFSLQGLSRYNYLASRPLQASSGTTLPSPDALHSSRNCLTCLSRGVVCEGVPRLVGPVDIATERFLAIHNTVQGYPDGYSGSLDRFRDTLDELSHVTASFETIFGDVRRRLALNLQEIRTNGFDFNVVLSKWAEENPNLPLDYDLLTWLATFFGWDSACNLSSFLVDPNDTARLEEFLRSTEVSADDPAAPSNPALVTTSVDDLTSAPRSPPVTTLIPPEPILRSRRRPAAAVPSNCSTESKFHTPPASTTADDEMDVEEGTSRTSVAQALVADHDESDDEEVAGDDTDEDVLVEIEPPSNLKSPKSRK